MRARPSLILAGERQPSRCPALIRQLSSEFTEEVRGKRIIWCTTNGTNAVAMAQQAEEVIRLTAFRGGCRPVCPGAETDCILIPAGLRGRYSLEDTWCAGYIAQHSRRVLSDSAKAALCIMQADVKDLKASRHGQVLASLALTADVEYCLALNANRNVIQKTQYLDGVA